jgi:hypothetical protein
MIELKVGQRLYLHLKILILTDDVKAYSIPAVRRELVHSMFAPGPTR